ncbi:MAG: cache domain-containing protein [Clostridiales bacterium]|jgi:hypothetical protein|nr:cache domain-containing protein [Clostridiales bacterium]
MRLKYKVILLVVCIFLVVALACLIVFFSIIRRVSRNNAEWYALSACQRLTSGIDSYFQVLDSAAYTVIYSNWLQEYFQTHDTENSLELYTKERNVSHFFSSVSQIYNDIGIIAFDIDGRFVTTPNMRLAGINQDFEPEKIFPLLDRDKRLIDFGDSKDYLQNKPNTPAVSVYYELKDYHRLFRRGILVFHIPQSNIYSLLQEENAAHTVALLNINGRVIYNNIWDDSVIALTREQIRSGIYNLVIWDKNRLNATAFHKSESTGWIAAYRVPYSVFEKESFSGYIWLMYALVPVSAFLLLITLVFSSYLTTPIVLCTNAIREIRNNWTD